MFIVLDPFDKRQKPELRDTAIMARMLREWNKQVKEAKIVARGSSPIPGLGAAGGFKLVVEDRGGNGLVELQKQTDALVRKLSGKKYLLTSTSLATLRQQNKGPEGVPEAVVQKLKPLKGQVFKTRDDLVKKLADVLDEEERKRYVERMVSSWPVPEAVVQKLNREDLIGKEYKTRADFVMKLAEVLDEEELKLYGDQVAGAAELPIVPGLNNVSSEFRSKTPQLFLDIDRTKAAALGVPLNDVNQTLDMYLGSLYVNSFNDFGRHWQVTIQAEGDYRSQVDKINLFKVRNSSGQMVPLGTLVTPREIGGPISVTRYNLYAATSVSGNVLPGYSTGDVIKNIQRIANENLPLSMRMEWTELMYMQLKAGNQGFYVFLLAILCVFLALSALYESWTLPLAVILVVPLCLLSSIAGVLFTNRDINIFVQIGLIVLVGLACKNAILIVEYAKQLHQEGQPVFEATRVASKLRLRPILMTSFAFIFGVMPLCFAAGAGAEMRRSLGVAVFSGMLGVTLFGIFLTPVFFYFLQTLGESRLFASATARWTVSSTAGGLLGLAIGYLLGLMGVVRLPWSAIVGAGAGVSLMLGLLEIRRRMKPLLGANGNANGGPHP
jgi:multidrug efflux pump subunit AcrB